MAPATAGAVSFKSRPSSLVLQRFGSSPELALRSEGKAIRPHKAAAVFIVRLAPGGLSRAEATESVVAAGQSPRSVFAGEGK
jgi:hypothetical protein